MKGPDVSNVIKDPEADVTYNVLAYRKLSRAEMVQSIRFYAMQRGKKKLSRGSAVTIISVIGASE
jgi:hypothetical protein